MRFINLMSYKAALYLIGFIVRPFQFLIVSRVMEESVLHISYNVHICLETVSLLRNRRNIGYLAVNSKCGDGPDVNFSPSRFGFIRAIQEWKILLTYICKFQIIHTHFGLGISKNGWEFNYLSRIGRKLVWHHRGCSSRDKKLNAELYPDSDFNICSSCDYNGEACNNPGVNSRRNVLNKIADRHIVTTPDLLDFYSNAQHIPFFSPTDIRALRPGSSNKSYSSAEPLKIVQITNHPGIEGAYEIQTIIDRLISQGYSIDYQFKKNISPEEALVLMSKAHVTIGKMKMGYYANNQLESIALGVPVITFIREKFITEELRNSAFILTDLKQLESTLVSILSNPSVLEHKKLLCEKTLSSLHDNNKIIDCYEEIYQGLGI